MSPSARAIRRCARRLLLAAALTAAALAVPAQEVGVAARVNGTEISVFRLERYFEDFLKERGRNLGAIRNPTAYKRLKREAMEELIERELLYQEAQRRGLAVDAAAVEAARARVAAAYKTPEAFRRRLADAGFSDAAFADYLRRQLMAERALAELTPAADADEEEVREAYRQNRERFARPEQVRARHILLRVPAGASTAAREAARQRLLELAARLRDGADFAALAERHSEDGSAASGGDLGYFARGTMVPPFEALAFSLASGEVGGPVETPFGWHLVRVEERRAAQAMPEAEALALLRRQLAAGRQAEARRQAVQALRQAARVEVLLPL
jgi:peptidyl-prolyl cis-trans isomerase C